MSRLAKKPIILPAGVTCVLEGQLLTLTGPKGTLSYTLLPTVKATVQDNSILLESTVSEGKEFAYWGLAWALIRSKITGVSVGFTKELEIQWVGYRAEVNAKNVVLSVGFSHKVTLDIPSDLTLATSPDNALILVVSGIDAQRVGEFAAKIRAVKPPEPYKGKGIRYVGEYVRRKAGKTGAK